MDENKHNKQVPEKSLSTIFQQVQPILTLVGTSTVLVAASGYMVHSSHLASYTDIPMIGVPTQYYIVAGLILLIHLCLMTLTLWCAGQVVALVDWLMKPLNEKHAPLWQRLGSALFGIGYLLVVGWWVKDRPDLMILTGILLGLHTLLVGVFARAAMLAESTSFGEQFKRFVQQPGQIFTRVHMSAVTMIATFLYIAFYVVLIASVYGSESYGNLSSIASGGRAATVSFIFEEDVQNLPTVLPMVDQYTTETLCLIATTDETYIIHIPAAETTVTIPRDAVFSLVDDQSDINC